MKKILIALTLSVGSMMTMAKEVVTVVYSWAASDPAANFDRAIIQEANRLQDRYQFVFEAKPGAGGVIAANHTLASNLAIMATSSAFYIRPVIYPNSYDLQQFRALSAKCTVTALIVSSKYSSWAQVPMDKPLSIGVSGLGTTTHLIALQIKQRYPNLTIVPFKGTSESLVNVLNGSLDLSVNFIGDIESWSQKNFTGQQISVLGVTGNRSIKNYPTLISQGFNNNLANMSPPHQYVAPVNMPDHKFKDIRNIIAQAQQTLLVREAYQIDRCEPAAPLNESQLQQWYQQQILQWATLATGVKVD